MTKPHEETWEVDGDGDVRRVNRKGKRTSLVWLKAASGSLEANVLGAAAPDMARALIEHVRYCDLCDGTGTISEKTGEDAFKDTPCPDCAADRAAIAKAGVLLPWYTVHRESPGWLRWRA